MPFVCPADASRAEIRQLGRDASRAAFQSAAVVWQSMHGKAGWLHSGIEHDQHGAPRIAHPSAPGLSITHTRGLAGCAIVGPSNPPIGIDAEPLAASARDALIQVAQETGEAKLPWSCDAWPLRLWCAKEAVVKAERIGADLMGRSLRIQHVGPLDESGEQRVMVRSHRDRVFAVTTSVVDQHVRAWTG